MVFNTHLEGQVDVFKVFFEGIFLNIYIYNHIYIYICLDICSIQHRMKRRWGQYPQI